MNALAKRLVLFLSKHANLDENRLDVYIYGADIALYTLFSTLGLLAIGLLFGMLFEAAIIIAVYYLNQTYGGGLHVSSHMRCFLLMSVFLALGLAVLRMNVPFQFFAVLGALSLVFLFAMPIVLHPNKSYLEPQRQSMKRRYGIIVIFEGAVFALILIFGINGLTQAMAMGIIFSALSKGAAGLWRKG